MKEFLRPTKEKVTITIVLLVTVYILIISCFFITDTSAPLPLCIAGYVLFLPIMPMYYLANFLVIPVAVIIYYFISSFIVFLFDSIENPETRKKLQYTTLIAIFLFVSISIVWGAIQPTERFDRFLKQSLTRSQVCEAYRNLDTNCDGSEYEEFKSNNEILLKDLGTACNTLKVSGCSEIASFQCIQACCLGCGATTNP